LQGASSDLTEILSAAHSVYLQRLYQLKTLFDVEYLSFLASNPFRIRDFGIANFCPQSGYLNIYLVLSQFFQINARDSSAWSYTTA
jgi:hypothetical protein